MVQIWLLFLDLYCGFEISLGPRLVYVGFSFWGPFGHSRNRLRIRSTEGNDSNRLLDQDFSDINPSMRNRQVTAKDREGSELSTKPIFGWVGSIPRIYIDWTLPGNAD